MTTFVTLIFVGMAINTTGEIEYNGVQFGPYTETESYSVAPVYDSSGRTVIYNKHTITFKSIVLPSAQFSADAISDLIRRSLTKNGAKLVVRGKGIGTISINDGQVTDVANGPKPEELSFSPATGADRAANLRWRITFCIPECVGAKYKDQPMEYNYTVTIAVDPYNGQVTRTIRGKLVIPQNRAFVGADTPQDSADAQKYLDFIDIPEIDEFRRSYGPRTLSEDRSTLSFEIIDTQLGRNMLPEGVTRCDMNLTQSSSKFGTAPITFTLSATYEVPRNGTINNAIKAYFNDLKFYLDRVRALKGFKGGQNAVIPLSYQQSEPEVYGRRMATFTTQWSATTSLSELLKSGIWEVRQNGNRTWEAWSKYNNENGININGSYDIKFSIEDDKIVNLCPSDLPKETTLESARDDDDMIKLLFPSTFTGGWMDFRNWLEFDSNDGAAMTRTLTSEPLRPIGLPGSTNIQNPLPLSGQGSLAAISQPLGAVGGGILSALVEGKLDADVRVNPYRFVYMKGYALRVGVPIPPPKLETVNGIKMIPASREDMMEKFWCIPIFRTPFTGTIIYKAMWKLRYAPERALPQDRPLPVLPNQFGERINAVSQSVPPTQNAQPTQQQPR